MRDDVERYNAQLLAIRRSWTYRRYMLWLRFTDWAWPVLKWFERDSEPELTQADIDGAHEVLESCRRDEYVRLEDL